MIATKKNIELVQTLENILIADYNTYVCKKNNPEIKHLLSMATYYSEAGYLSRRFFDHATNKEIIYSVRPDTEVKTVLLFLMADENYLNYKQMLQFTNLR